MSAAAGLALAVVSACLINGGLFVQHAAVSAAPTLLLRHPWSSLRSLLASPAWIAGYLAGIVGWAIYVTALALASLSLVQAASAGGIGVIALLTWRSGKGRLTNTERIATVLAIAGLLLLSASLGPRAPTVNIASGSVILWVCAAALAAAIAAGPLSTRLRPGAGLGVAAGCLYAAGDIATKGALTPGGSLWLIPILLTCHLGGFVTINLGFQRGSAMTTAGPATLLLSAIPISAGLILFHDGLPNGAAGLVRVVAFAAVVTGAVLLAAPAATGQAEGQGAFETGVQENPLPAHVSSSDS